MELQLLPRRNLRDIFFLRCQIEPPEVKACVMDALKDKTRRWKMSWSCEKGGETEVFSFLEVKEKEICKSVTKNILFVILIKNGFFCVRKLRTDSSLCFVFSALRFCRLLPRVLGEQNRQEEMVRASVRI